MHIDSRHLPANFHSEQLSTSGVAGNMTMLADIFPPNICWMSFPGRVFGSTTQECRGLQLDHRASRFGAMPDVLFVSASSPRPPSPKEEVEGGGDGRGAWARMAIADSNGHYFSKGLAEQGRWRAPATWPTSKGKWPGGGRSYVPHGGL